MLHPVLSSPSKQKGLLSLLPLPEAVPELGLFFLSIIETIEVIGGILLLKLREISEQLNLVHLSHVDHLPAQLHVQRVQIAKLVVYTTQLRPNRLIFLVNPALLVLEELLGSQTLIFNDQLLEETGLIAIPAQLPDPLLIDILELVLHVLLGKFLEGVLEEVSRHEETLLGEIDIVVLIGGGVQLHSEAVEILFLEVLERGEQQIVQLVVPNGHLEASLVLGGYRLLYLLPGEVVVEEEHPYRCKGQFEVDFLGTTLVLDVVDAPYYLDYLFPLV